MPPAKLKFFRLLAGAVTLSTCASVGAGEASGKAVAAASPFDAGRHELQIGTGMFVSFQTTSAIRPQINDVGGHVRLGWMLGSPAGEGIWRGNYEFLATAQGSGILKGPGSVLAGGSLILRRNFVPSSLHWVPYSQLEVGALSTDADRQRVQHALGGAFEFQVGGGFGLRYLASESWGAYLEADFRHISNAGIYSRNAGTNAAGGFLGVSRFFLKRGIGSRGTGTGVVKTALPR